MFPLFYLDRALGWTYSGGAEPLAAVNNGLQDFLRSHVTTELFLTPPEIRETLREAFRRGEVAAVEAWVSHTDGSRYVTSILIEGMDDGDVAYFAKFNGFLNHTGHPMPFDRLLSDLFVYPDGTALITLHRDAPAVDALAAMSSLDAFRHVFGDLYGYSWAHGPLTRHGKTVASSNSGLDEFLCELDRGLHQISTDAGVPKQQQFRLGRNVFNRFEPIQQYLRFVQTDSILSNELGKPLIREVSEQLRLMDAALQNVLKFVSLLTVKPIPTVFELYVEQIRTLRDLQPAYRQANLAVMKSLTT
ncbi:hypothetical protein AB0C15_21685 [Micromonospora sp. NPDC048835]|uniref:hypothetical protein n=1 Tax=Micromonospora sp. NPDC048835 TaxID=3155147 RepID=UPI00340BF800